MAQYKECMMKKLFMMLWGGVFAIVISGCASGITEPEPIIFREIDDRIALEVEILDKRETYHAVWKAFRRGKAVMYLKIYDKKNPEISMLYPLNVERKDSGSGKNSVITPFEYGTPTVLVVELLDDNCLDDEEVELLVEAARAGAMIVCDASQAYKISKIEADAIFRNKGRIVSLATSGAKVLAKDLNQHKFDTLDIYEYTFDKGRIFLSKAFTILNNDNKHCDIKFY